MKKTFHVIFASILFISACKAQTLEWVNVFGGTSNDIIATIAVDANGDIVSFSRFANTVDVDPGPGITNFISNGQDDFCIQKLNSSGGLIWAKQIGGVLSEGTNDIVIDDSSNIIISGYFKGTTDFDPGPGIFNLTSLGTYSDFFLLKINSNGDFQWAKSMHSSQFNFMGNLATDDNNNIYQVGGFSDSLDIDPSAVTLYITSVAIYDYAMFIQKLNPDGSLAWYKKIDENGSQGANAIVTTSNAIYVAGFIVDTVDVDPGPGVVTFESQGSGSADGIILKLDLNGNYLWHKHIGGPSTDDIYSIDVDNNDDLILAGIFTNSADFNVGGTPLVRNSAGGTDCFVGKMNSSGNWLWVNSMGGTGADNANIAKADQNNLVYVVGRFEGTCDFDPSPSNVELTATNSSYDGFMAKYDVNGDILQAWKIGGPYFLDNIYGLDFNNNAEVFISGYFGDSVDFNPINGPDITVSNGSVDGFVAKFSCGLMDASITHSADTIWANAVGVNYQWLDCANNFNPFVGETNQQYIYNQLGGVAVRINQYGCLDTSSCISLVGIELSDYNPIIAYPNPTSSYLNFNIDATIHNKITIMNLAGQILETLVNINSVNLEYFACGTYIICLDYLNIKIYHRIIKQ